MTPEDRDLLSRLDERVLGLTGKFDAFITHADNGGWQRCTEHKATMKSLSDNQKIIAKSQRWLRNVIIGTVLVFLLTSALNFTKSDTAADVIKKPTVTSVQTK